MILSVLPIEEISLRPELVSTPRFRFQGGYPERDTGGGGGGAGGEGAGRYLPFHDREKTKKLLH